MQFKEWLSCLSSRASSLTCAASMLTIYTTHLTARSESMSTGQATSTFNNRVFTHCTTALTHRQTVALLTLCMSVTGWYCAPLPSQWSASANCCFTDGLHLSLDNSNAEQRASRQPFKTFLWTRKRTQTQSSLVVCILFSGVPRPLLHNPHR